MIRTGGGDGVERARYLLGSKVIMLFLRFGAEVQFAFYLMLMLQTHESLEAHS